MTTGRRRVLAAVALLAGLSLAWPAATPAQSLGIALFERYLDALRQQVGIPGLSAAIVQDGAIVWERGFGYADVSRAIPARPDTPYPIGDLSQTLAAALVLDCLGTTDAVDDDRMDRWTHDLPERDATVIETLTHRGDRAFNRAFHYNPARFMALTALVEWCGGQPYGVVLSDRLLRRFGMTDTVPGDALADPASRQRERFDVVTLARFDAAVARMALPYRGARRAAPVAGVYQPLAADASTGVVSTVRDLARFDAALEAGAVIDNKVLDRAWHPVVRDGVALPFGLGWFVQTADGQRLVWHFGAIPGAYSSLMLKAPDRGLTLLLLANSDGLSAPFSLPDGDVTRSLFASLFLRLTS